MPAHYTVFYHSTCIQINVTVTYIGTDVGSKLFFTASLQYQPRNLIIKANNLKSILINGNTCYKLTKLYIYNTRYTID